MPKPDTNSELDDLRQQLQQLAVERAQATASATPEPPDPPASEDPGEELSAWLDPNGELDPDAIIENIQAGLSKWLDGFNEDLKDARPSTLLAIFGLGVLVGKLTR